MKTHKNTYNLFIIGTDTGVGKTVLSLLFMQYLFLQQYKPFYIKPFQSGCRNPYDNDSDARFIYRHTKHLNKKDPADSVIYCLNDPKAPWFASRNQGISIEPLKVKKIVAEKSNDYSPLVIEAAGGIFVPVNDQTLIIDILIMTKATPIIAARAGLGTINHTLLTIDALKQKGLKPAGVFLIDTGSKQTPTEMIKENIEAIETFSDISVAGVIGHIKDFSNPEKSCYQPIRQLLDQLKIYQ